MPRQLAEGLAQGLKEAFAGDQLEELLLEPVDLDALTASWTVQFDVVGQPAGQVLEQLLEPASLTLDVQL